MNLTIVHLSLQLFCRSPYFSFSSANTESSVSLSNIFVKKSFHNFFRDSNNKNNIDLKIYSSGFHHFLAPVIYTESESTYIHKRFYTRTVLKHYQKYKIKKCLFTDCRTNLAYNGGAIICINAEIELQVRKSAFVNCYATTSGGSIYAVCKSIDTAMTCFEGSKTDNNGQSVVFESTLTLVEQVIVFDCGPETKSLSQTSLFRNGSVSIQNSNFSSNRPVTSECCVSLVSCEALNFRLNNIEKNNGNGLFYIFEGNELSCFEQCNVVNNSSPSESPPFVLLITTFTIRQFIFINNSFGKYFDIKKGNQIIVSNCKFDHNESIFENDNGIIAQNNCIFNQISAHTNHMTIPMTNKCFAYEGTDVTPSQTPKQTPPPSMTEFIVTPTAQPPLPTQTPIIWVPNGLFFVQYWLIIYASIITPIFILIHCITTKSTRSIRALN